MIFAAVFYGPKRTRWVYALLLLLLVGPKLWALLPIWVLGSLLYRVHHRMTIGAVTARVMLGATIALVLAIVVFHLTGPLDHLTDRLSGGWISRHLRFSQWFAGDTLMAIVLAANLFAAKYARLGFGRLTAPIRILASFSFTLYLTHWPLLEFWRSYIGLAVPKAVVAASCCTLPLGLVTEHQKDWLRVRLRVLWRRRTTGRHRPINRR